MKGYLAERASNCLSGISPWPLLDWTPNTINTVMPDKSKDHAPYPTSRPPPLILWLYPCCILYLIRASVIWLPIGDKHNRIWPSHEYLYCSGKSHIPPILIGKNQINLSTRSREANNNTRSGTCSCPPSETLGLEPPSPVSSDRAAWFK